MTLVGGSAFKDARSYFEETSKYYALQANLPNNYVKQADLQSLSTGYNASAYKLASLDGQLDELNDNVLVIKADVSSMLRHFGVVRNGSAKILNNTDRFRQVLEEVSDLEHLLQPIFDRLTHISEIYISSSLKLFSANLGRCGHLAFIYSVISDACFFVASR